MEVKKVAEYDNWLEDDLNFMEEDGQGFVNHYTKLWIWQQSMELVKSVYPLLKKLPDEERFGLNQQLRRSVVSVPSNIAEGWGRSKKGYLHQGLRIARGSLHEVETQLHIALELEMLWKEDVDPLFGLIKGLSADMLKFMNRIEVK